MNVNDDLITRWEPQVHFILQKMHARSEEYEDLAQELRLTIVKAAKKFEPSRGVLFHTYLYTAMKNRIGTIYSKSQRDIPTFELFDFLADSSSLTDETLLDLKFKHLTSAEMLVVDLFLCGYKKSDIRRFGISNSNLNCVMKSLREKFKD